jgi:hypothetical protein
MLNNNANVRHTDLYGTWTCVFTTATDIGLDLGSTFRITKPAQNPAKHTLEKRANVRWNESADPIELVPVNANTGYLFRAGPVDIVGPDGQLHQASVLINSNDGMNLIIDVKEVVDTGHTGTATAGRP